MEYFKHLVSKPDFTYKLIILLKNIAFRKNWVCVNCFHEHPNSNKQEKSTTNILITPLSFVPIPKSAPKHYSPLSSSQSPKQVLNNGYSSSGTEQFIMKKTSVINQLKQPRFLETNSSSSTGNITTSSNNNKYNTGPIQRSDFELMTQSSKQTNRNLSLITTATRTSILTISSEELLQSVHSHRMRIIIEILETEKTYVANLDILIEKFMQPFSTWNAQKCVTIFSNVTQIRDMNTILLRNLEDRLQQFNDNLTQIGDLFVNLGPYFKPYYSTYGTNYSTAQQALKEAEEHDPNIAIKLEKISLSLPDTKKNSLRSHQRSFIFSLNWVKRF